MPIPMLIRRLGVSLLVAISLGSALAGCSSSSDTTDTGVPDQAVSTDPPTTVPDVVDTDGADAQSQIEDAGYTVSAESEDRTFDSSRDLTDCNVTDQDPAGDTEADTGAEVTLTVDCSDVDWGDQQGDAWDTFASAFEDAVSTTCEDFVNQTPDGSLHLNDQEYGATECENAATTDPADADYPQDLPDDPESAGQELAVSATCQAFFDSAGTTEFYVGSTTYTVDDCESSAGSTGGTSKSSATTTKPKASDAAVKDCSWNSMTSYDQVSVRNISCDEAEALVKASGTYTDNGFNLAGWSCSSVKGSYTEERCTREDKAIRFSSSE